MIAVCSECKVRVVPRQPDNTCPSCGAPFVPFEGELPPAAPPKGLLGRIFFAEPIPEEELEEPKLRTLLKIVRNAVSRVFKDDVGKLLGSAFVLLMIWGYHGELELLHEVWRGWTGPGSYGHPWREDVISGIPWDQIGRAHV